jgi:spore germination cell wall hydrolase CwlJ-like protein
MNKTEYKISIAFLVFLFLLVVLVYLNQPDEIVVKDHIITVPESLVARELVLPTEIASISRGSYERVKPPEPAYSDEELELLYAIVWAESGNSYMNMVATATVIINRINSKYFPDTIYDVVYQGNGVQFNAVRREDFGYYDPENTVEAVHEAIDNPIFDSSVVYFANVSIATDSSFINNVLLPNKVAEYGGHTFARDPRIQ